MYLWLAMRVHLAHVAFEISDHSLNFLDPPHISITLQEINTLKSANPDFRYVCVWSVLLISYKLWFLRGVKLKDQTYFVDVRFKASTLAFLMIRPSGKLCVVG
jgi:hypothetical protein